MQPGSLSTLRGFEWASSGGSSVSVAGTGLYGLYAICGVQFCSLRLGRLGPPGKQRLDWIRFIR